MMDSRRKYYADSPSIYIYIYIYTHIYISEVDFIVFLLVLLPDWCIDNSFNHQISMSDAVREARPVVRKFLARQQREGVGAVVRRSIGRPEIKYFDPFLALDEFSVPGGFPDHPHRGGFETVTYMLQGAITHEDFEGHKGTIEAGDVQWMTAGRGIVHSEMPAGEGTQKGLQLWINLSSRYKMIEPRYQEMCNTDIAEAARDGVKVRVIAGEAMGVSSTVHTITPTMYLDFTIKPGSHIRQAIPPTWNAFVYTLEGEGTFGNSRSTPVSPHHLLLLGPGDGLNAWNRSGRAMRFLLVGGEPLEEAVVQHGPFVMNSQEEIEQAVEDYESCSNGFEKARCWKSELSTAFGY
ncbi:pirin-like protein isoform X3 [Andrographis paniculata]|uniref:pirin-like protein isoform X3 n=1 Tax=Andrographis paniculata TaxID=175694 RepID=UPI0021E7B8BC|nr:pirin-like protein isoform X3 [Andrographis paniculata]